MLSVWLQCVRLEENEMNNKMKSRLERFKLKMSNPMYYLRQSNCASTQDCPFCGGTAGDHDEDCELDE